MPGPSALPGLGPQAIVCCMCGTVVPALLCSRSQCHFRPAILSHPCCPPPIPTTWVLDVSDAVFSQGGGTTLLPTGSGLLKSEPCSLPRSPLPCQQARSVHACACSEGRGQACAPTCPPLHSCPVTDHYPCCLLEQRLPAPPPPLHQRSWYNQLPIL